VHGELGFNDILMLRQPGSSPRAWGTPTAGGIPGADHRFIPTCMGNSGTEDQHTHIRAVHPHVHGELPALGRFLDVDHGSSPRAWGTHRDGDPGRPGRRFIPTCMGNSVSDRSRRPAASVHPHVHGELGADDKQVSIRLGSSPRAWGTRGRLNIDWEGLRFIPTCMGNSSSDGVESTARTVHPHVHGELLDVERITSGQDGSSPRAWGTH